MDKSQYTPPHVPIVPTPTTTTTTSSTVINNSFEPAPADANNIDFFNNTTTNTVTPVVANLPPIFTSTTLPVFDEGTNNNNNNNLSSPDLKKAAQQPAPFQFPPLVPNQTYVFPLPYHPYPQHFPQGVPSPYGYPAVITQFSQKVVFLDLQGNIIDPISENVIERAAEKLLPRNESNDSLSFNGLRGPKLRTVLHCLVLLMSMATLVLELATSGTKWKFHYRDGQHIWDFGYFEAQQDGYWWGYDAIGKHVHALMNASACLYIIGVTFTGFFVILFTLQTFYKQTIRIERFTINVKLLAVIMGLLSTVILALSFSLIFALPLVFKKDGWCNEWTWYSDGYTVCNAVKYSGDLQYWGPVRAWYIGLCASYIQFLPAGLALGLYIKDRRDQL